MKTNLMLILASVCALQWIVCASISAFSRTLMPKKTLLRTQEKALIVSSIVFLAGWLVAFDAWPLLSGSSRGPTTEAAMTGRKQLGSCASLDAGMTTAEVRAKVGKPDEERPDVEVRGPGATLFLYRGSRCSVHFLDDRVEFVD